MSPEKLYREAPECLHGLQVGGICMKCGAVKMYVVEVEPDKIREIAATLDELLSYCPDYFRDKWGLDTAVAEAKGTLGIGGTDE